MASTPFKKLDYKLVKISDKKFLNWGKMGNLGASWGGSCGFTSAVRKSVDSYLYH